MQESGEQTLDAVAGAVFGGEAGHARLVPLLDRFRACVGEIREDDAHCDLLQAIRTDWALCDAAVPGGAGVGDTWLRRALAGDVPGVEPDPAWTLVNATYVGLFEVWPGPMAWLRDRVHGLSLALRDPVHLVPAQNHGPAALWEVRIRIEHGHARLCREPLTYPLEILAWLEQANTRRFTAEGAPLDWLQLRRSWLQLGRARRADPLVFFDR